MHDSGINGLYGGVISYSHSWFQIEVYFSTHSFAAPKSAEKTPPRVNILNPRLQLKAVAGITCHPRRVFSSSWSWQKQSPPKLFYFLCSISQNRIYLSSFLLNHFSTHLFPPPPIALYFSSKSPQYILIITCMPLYLLYKTISFHLLYLPGFHKCLSLWTIVNLLCDLSKQITRKATLRHFKSKVKEKMTFWSVRLCPH